MIEGRNDREDDCARGLRVPICERLVALIHEIEDGRPMASSNLDELRRVSASAYPQ
jgi:hypothetical protein